MNGVDGQKMNKKGKKRREREGTITVEFILDSHQFVFVLFRDSLIYLIHRNSTMMCGRRASLGTSELARKSWLWRL